MSARLAWCVGQPSAPLKGTCPSHRGLQAGPLTVTRFTVHGTRARTGGGNGIRRHPRWPLVLGGESLRTHGDGMLALEDTVLGPRVVSAHQDPNLPATYSHCCSTNSQRRGWQ